MGKGLDGQAGGPNSGLSAKEEGKQVSQAKSKAGELKPGDVYFVLAAEWFRRWQSYTSESEAEKPGPIDNRVILLKAPEGSKDEGDKETEEYEPQLKPGLIDPDDYVQVSEAEWKLLFGWYGGGPSIPRWAISEGNEDHAVTRVEVYLHEFRLYLVKADGFPDMSASKTAYLSKRKTLRELVILGAELYKAKESMTRIWDWEDENDTQGLNCRLISDLDPTIEAAGLIHGQQILVEKTKRPGVWPRDNAAFLRAKHGDSSNGTTETDSGSGGFLSIFGMCFGKERKPTPGASKQPNGEASAASSTTQNYGNDAHAALVARSKTSEFPPGLCGLRNLGNTCFMNSALQCLSNTTLLRNYFLEGRFKGDINEKNALGMQGNIAKQFGSLLRSLWSGEFSSVAPKNFKQTLGRWAPQFEGFNQHDAHELLAFLLDGLHEDLNRISGKKPYVEVKEGHGRPDQEVAEEAWSGHLKRNSSVIVDFFHGQLKSTVTCPECNHISVTFDPFMYLSLPLQQESSRNIELSFWYLNDFNRGSKYSVKVPRGGTVSDVRSELAKLTKISSKNIIITQVAESHIVRVMHDGEDTASFGYGSNYMAYEFPNGAKTAEKRRTVALHVIHRQRKRRSAVSVYGGPSYGHPWDFYRMALPFILELVRGVTTGRDLYQLVWNKCSRFINLYDDEDSDEEGESDDEDDDDDSNTSSDDSSEGDGPSGDSISTDKRPKQPNGNSNGTPQPKKRSKKDEASESRSASATPPPTKDPVDSKDSKDSSSAPSESTNGDASPSSTSTATTSTAETTDSKAKSTSTATANGTKSPKPTKHRPAPAPPKAKTGKPKSRYLDSYRYDTYPFKLAFVNPLGSSCSICGNNCDGCVLKPTDDPIFLAPSVKTPTIAIEWPSQILDHYYEKTEACGVTIHPSLAAARAETKRSETSLALRDCLNMYTTVERLSENDPWYCPTCKTHRCAWKKLDLWKLPEILVVHLKRFHFSATQRAKLNWQVDFPTRDLCLDEFVINPDAKGIRYELFAVANHMGGLSAGHYTASAKCDVTNQWYTFDDSHVSPAKEKNLDNPNAYVLFYRRSTVPDPASDVNEIEESREAIAPVEHKPKKRASKAPKDPKPNGKSTPNGHSKSPSSSSNKSSPTNSASQQPNGKSSSEKKGKAKKTVTTAPPVPNGHRDDSSESGALHSTQESSEH